MSDMITAIVPKSPYVKADGWSLNIAASTPYEVLCDAMCSLANFHRRVSGVQFVVGDAIIFADEHYGELAAQMFESAGFSSSYLRDALWMARKFKPGERRIDDGLSFSHHKVVASLSPADRQEFLERALVEGLNRDQLEAQVRAWKDGHRLPESPVSSGKTDGGDDDGEPETVEPVVMHDDASRSLNLCPECSGDMVIAPCPHCFERVLICKACFATIA